MISERLRVDTGQPYDVVIGNELHGELDALLDEEVRRVAIIHPIAMQKRANVMRSALAGSTREVHLIEVPDGESAKQADVVTFCWSVLGEAGFTRSDAIVGLGGGSTTDLAGFAAASWLRGVKLVTVPTTVLGMVDAAVGGKTGINTSAGKNLVGAFHEPAGVICDLDSLTTLPGREVRSGLAEIIKCGFISDLSILELIEAAPAAVLDVSGSILPELIAKGIRVKANTVAGDLRESGLGVDGSIGREALNYGHTLGHAIEKLERYGIRHGEAISIGMVFVAELAAEIGALRPEDVRRHRDILELVGLPTMYRKDTFDVLLRIMAMDKKSRGSRLRFVILDDIGFPRILDGPDERTLAKAFSKVTK